MDAILSFIYTGNAHINDSMIVSIADTAFRLGIKPIIRSCYGKGLMSSNAITMFDLAVKRDEFEFAVKSLKKAPKYWYQDENSLQLVSSNGIKVAIQSIFNAESVVLKWNILARWALAHQKISAEEDFGAKMLHDVIQDLRKSGLVFDFTQQQCSSTVSPFVHSIKDRMLKQTFSDWMKNCILTETDNSALVSKVFDSKAKLASVIDKLNKYISEADNANFPSTELSWELLFRGSEHAFNSTILANSVNNVGPTITLFRAAKTRVYFGAAYNGDRWDLIVKSSQNLNGFLASIGFIGMSDNAVVKRHD